jgi:2-phosphosulfolactate phosphatase
MAEWVDVALWPGEPARTPAETVIVVDLFRATTTIATLFARGLRRLTACADIGLARELRDEQGAILFGEVRGLPPGDFDYGNSPVEAASLDLGGRDAILFTTNGTGALAAAARESRVYAGALANISAVAREAAGAGSVRVVCAGNDGGRRTALEDALAGGAFVEAIRAQSPACGLSDNARLLLAAARSGDFREMILSSHHALSLRELGLERDMEFALERDTSSATPLVTGWGPSWARLENVSGAPRAPVTAR